MAVAALLPVTLLAGSGHAEDPDLSWPPAGIFQQDHVGVVTGRFENFSIGTGSGVAYVIDGDWRYCRAWDDPACAKIAASGRWESWEVSRGVPSCSDATPWEECIESLSIISANGRLSRSRLMGVAAGTPTFPADPARGLPTGSTTSLWSDPSGTTTGYAIDLVGFSRTSPGEEVSRQSPMTLDGYALHIRRYRWGPADATRACEPWSTPTSCAYEIPFEDGDRLSVSYLMSDGPNQWLSGRLQDPDVEVQAARERLVKVTVTAAPVEVPMAAAAVPFDEASPELKSAVRKFCLGTPCVFDAPPTVTALYPLLDAIKPLVGDTAQKVLPLWSLQTLIGDVLPDRCEAYLKAEDSILALVTTNATGYAGMVWKIDDELKYEVAALHYLPSGEPFKGTFNLLMRSDAARCAWNLPRAPVTATIEVTSEDGEEQVATTAVSDRGGWLKLAASGFGFSRPTITAKITTTAKKKTIVCKKGKKTKKVTGYAPRCPSGWKPARP